MTALTLPARSDAPVGAVRGLVADLGAMAARAVRLTVRDVDSMITAAVLPVVILLMFTYVFGGAMDVGTSYITYATPGIILLAAGFGAASTALFVERDMSGGMIDRVRSMPVVAWTVLAGHVAASLVKNLLTTAIVFAVAWAVGFRPTADVAGWLGAIGVLVLFLHAITWSAVLVGVLVRSPDAASGFTFVVMFLPYVSSAFVPVESMPTWLRGFAEHQPVTPVIESVRGLLVGGTPGAPTGDALTDTIVLAVAWCVGLSAVFAAASAAAFRRRR
ncbi:ABC-2 type transport system permease protein [Isoptericola jiangsuensis]|uniref:Transport permease protein n=1 Tax=Isoptericola jiangsuensis TaxID=548579 RepID=A0A2A9F2T0_9MICO|nr:ABC transporter permease [Isoptericola jiangsuensis]PFG41369.1 ABC-2 type transport system permease protein [Isoptericola jiangsuensis]PFG44862.1 ABC-2 type transport system permease protein [Isoptericola jiangsuensis]